MSLRRLLWAGTAAYISYNLVKNRKVIQQEAVETKELTDEATAQVKDILKQMTIIQNQLPVVTGIVQDLNKKAETFKHEVDIRTKQMPLLHKEDTSTK
ncbi:hypothetical protein [Streptococcus merionis]|uniref:Lipoprotein n=1 Tax=Streptococcus merionis TaxID=400065 RepID=A0A239T2H2_9STRE|nr:hypothetical protein [Streptococcus merionis]SNU91053.1 lipoprotein [Streptococcus merionis]